MLYKKHASGDVLSPSKCLTYKEKCAFTKCSHFIKSYRLLEKSRVFLNKATFIKENVRSLIGRT